MCELLLKNLADGEKSQKTPGRGGGGVKIVQLSLL